MLDLVSCQFVPAGVGVFTLGATENFVFLIWLKMLPPIMLAETVLPPVHLATFSTVEHGLTWLCFKSSMGLRGPSLTQIGLMR